jgi:hypothetical protein
MNNTLTGIEQNVQYLNAHNTISNFDHTDVIDHTNDIAKIEQDMRLLRLQTLKMTGKIEDSQYKSILGMLASPDERDLEMARLSIRTLWDEHL